MKPKIINWQPDNPGVRLTESDIIDFSKSFNENMLENGTREFDRRGSFLRRILAPKKNKRAGFVIG